MLTLVFHEMNRAANAGVILRLAAATDSKVIFTGERNRFSGKRAKRASAGYDKQANSSENASLTETIAELQQQGVTVYATSPRATISYTELDLRKPIAFVFGSESLGLSEREEVLADKVISLPMPGKTESLNVALTAAVLVYEFLRQNNREK
jgi:tRNA G18 (ribose-2'-O)-methylase SpoU